ncbi:MAG: bifunctional ornithine acetyltransferase/N-acetylglutamate synthase, partial [Chloroflexota bacterium]
MDVEIVENGSVTSPQGFSAGAVYAGIKTYGESKLDLGLLISQVPGHAAGIFTTNRVKAAPVLWCRERLAGGRAQAVVVNSGVANACVGPRGREDAAQMARLAAARLAVDPGLVLVASTGKIGVPLPMEKIAAGLERIALSRDGGHELARCIMTTDTFPKEVAVRLVVGGVPVTVAGTAKGAGMIHPQMATMLAFLTTDAAVEPGFLPKALARAAADSFHMVSVDGDMSTNDTLVVLANGLAGNRPIA